MSFRDYVNEGCEPDDAPPTHCPGPSYPNAGGCGRFLASGCWMCERCRQDSDFFWHEEAARDRQYIAANIAIQHANEAAYYDDEVPF